MWKSIAVNVLRYRLPLLGLLVALTGLMSFFAFRVEMNHNLHKTVPDNNPVYQSYQQFREYFGEEGNLLFIATQSDQFFTQNYFTSWHQLGNDIAAMNGVDEVVSPAHTFRLVANRKARKFETEAVPLTTPGSQAEVDSIHQLLDELPFYDGLLWNKESHTYLMAISLNSEIMDSELREALVENILALSDQQAESLQTEFYYAGMPWIRSYKQAIISQELKIFLLLAMCITMVLLFVLFRSLYAVIFPMLIIGSGILISVGLMGLMGYKVNVLTGLIPTLLVVIGIPNCVYMLNKYHTEFRKHGNQIRALSTIIEQIGYVTFFANLTTAIGTSVFYFTGVKVLQEFGIVAGLSISATFILSTISIPVIFSYLPKPHTGQTVHLERRFMNAIIDRLDWITFNRKRTVLITASLIAVVSIVGLSRLGSKGYILDDIPGREKIYTDLKFFEQEFKGVLPFEILVQRKDSVSITSLPNLQKIEKAQQLLEEYPALSRSVSVVDGLKFARQAYYNGRTRYYALPSGRRLSTNDAKISDWIERSDNDNLDNNGFLLPDKNLARISVQTADIGSDSMPKLLAELQPKLLEIFPEDKYEITFTGTSILALEGYNYLVRGLIWSVLLAFLLIAGIMAYLFRSPRMLMLALLPNLVPLMVTAAIMGFAQIPLKPSTVLTFGIAFGISVDFTIHFLAKYRQELYRNSFNLVRTVSTSLRETGRSMIYTFLILLCGFIIFTGSKFQGTSNLGVLTSITLVVALLTNLLLLPSLLLTVQRQRAKHEVIAGEPLMTVFDEEEDIALDKLDFRKESNGRVAENGSSNGLHKEDIKEETTQSEAPE